MRRHAFPIVAAATLCAACEKQQPIPFTNEMISEMQGKPTCVATYDLTGPQDVLEREGVLIADDIYRLAGIYLGQNIPVSGDLTKAEIIGFNYGSGGGKPPAISVKFLKPCSDIANASARFLDFLHTGDPASRLPDDVRLAFVSSVDEPLEMSAAPTGSAP